MQGEHSKQSNFFGVIYEELIPANHLLGKLAAAVDPSFISQTVSDCYCPDNGRSSWDPLVLFRVVLLPFLYDLSDREIEEQVKGASSGEQSSPRTSALQSHSNISLASLQEAPTSPHCDISGVRNESTKESQLALLSELCFERLTTPARSGIWCSLMLT